MILFRASSYSEENRNTSAGWENFDSDKEEICSRNHGGSISRAAYANRPMKRKQYFVEVLTCNDRFSFYLTVFAADFFGGFFVFAGSAKMPRRRPLE